MIKVLALGDYCCSTGFSTVMSNIMRQLHATGKYDIDVVGINYDGNPYDTDKFPGKVYPALSIANMHLNDPYGRQKALDLLGAGDYDIFFMVNDTFIAQTFINEVNETKVALQKKFSTILYFPVDCQPKEEWITKCVGLIDFPVVYTDYGRRITCDLDPSVASRLKVLYHGTNTKEFFPIEDGEAVANFRYNYFAGKADGKFLITNVNRNQVRKDPMRNFMVLNELRSRGRENAVLYLHMAHDDAGGNLLIMADHFNFKLQEDFILPSPRVFTVNRGIPVEALNLIYNASDALLSTTLGEGWGLSITEAMATKLPIVAPNNTSLTEILDNNRGYLAASGNTPSLWNTLGAGDLERLRPLLDVESAADQIERIMDGELPDLEGAYEWAVNLSWDNICKEWEQIFDQAALNAQAMTNQGIASLNRKQRRKAKR